MSTVRPSTPVVAPRGIPRLRRRIAVAAAAAGLAVVAFLPGGSVFGDSTPSQAQTAPAVVVPGR